MFHLDTPPEMGPWIPCDRILCKDETKIVREHLEKHYGEVIEGFCSRHKGPIKFISEYQFISYETSNYKNIYKCLQCGSQKRIDLLV